MAKIAVIGAGVIGITTALEIQERLGLPVTIYAEELSPNTTSDIAAGLWEPYICSDTPDDKIYKWSKATFDYLVTKWRAGNAKEMGIMLILMYNMAAEENIGLPSWKNIPFGCQELSKAYLQKFNNDLNTNYVFGFSFVTFIWETATFLPHFYRKFIENGGEIVIKRIEEFNELKDYDVIVNCTGLNAQKLVKDDKICPIRGQVTRVNAPWQFYTIIDNNNYIIPNQTTVVLGGTQQIGNYNLKVNENDKNTILNGCYNIVPSLQSAKIVKHVVGLRPGRTEVRLDTEDAEIDGKALKIVHNYGHGGSGITLSIGCAKEACDLVVEALKNKLSKL